MTGFLLGKLHAINILGMVCYQEVNFIEARQYFEENLVLCQKGGFRFAYPLAFVGLAGLISKVWLKTKQEGLLEQIGCIYGVSVALQNEMQAANG